MLVEDKEDRVGRVVVVIGDLNIENIFQEKSLYSRVLEQGKPSSLPRVQSAILIL